MEKQPTPEEKRHNDLVQALYKIVDAIQGLKSEVSLIKHTIQTPNKR